MGQNKLEKQFKEKLNSREIIPSEMAWDRLNAMLTFAEQKKPKQNYSWIYIAASMVGLAFLGTFFYNLTNQNTNFDGHKVVQENIKKTAPIKENLAKVRTIPTAESIVAILGKKKTTSSSNTKNAIIKTQLTEDSPIENLTPTVEKKGNNQEEIQVTAVDKIDLNVDQMLAEIQANPKETSSKAKIKVNPSMLLTQVDGELELSFREKVINKVNKNYQTVKVALANRNHH